MLGTILMKVTSLLATMEVSPGTHLPPSVDRNIEARDEEAPNVAAITAVPPTAFESYTVGRLVRGDITVLIEGQLGLNQKTAAAGVQRWTCSVAPSFTWGDEDDGGTGVAITNADTAWRAFYFYYNACDYVPYKYVWVSPGGTVFVSLPAMFQGRITRGTDEWNLGGIPRPLGTWLELAIDNESWIWGDVSLIRGCDGGVLMWSQDGSGSWKGFVKDILTGGPPGVYDVKPSGQWVIAATENWDGTTNWTSMLWDLEMVGPEVVYVDDAHGNPVIVSKNGRFGTFWPSGRL